MKRNFILLLILIGLATISCQKNREPDVFSKKFRAIVLSQETTCKSWQIKFDENLSQIFRIMGKDLTNTGVYSPINLPDSLKITGTSFNVQIRQKKESEAYPGVCNTLGLPPTWIYLIDISDIRYPIR